MITPSSAFLHYSSVSTKQQLSSLPSSLVHLPEETVAAESDALQFHLFGLVSKTYISSRIQLQNMPTHELVG